MAVGAAVGLVPRQVGVAEQHDVGVRKPAAEPGAPADRVATVVHRGERAALDLDLDPFGETHPVVVVAEHGVHRRVPGEHLQHGMVDDVAGVDDDVGGVDDDVGGLQLRRDQVGEPRLVTSAQVRVADHEHTRHALSLPREGGGMRIAFGTDERTAVTDHVKEVLAGLGHEIEIAGEGDAWPDVGRRVGELVAGGSCDLGVVSCWTGTGVSIAANKVAGVRAALCTDAETARGARRWNDANVLAFGLRLTTTALADELLDAFLGATTEPSEAPNIAKLG